MLQCVVLAGGLGTRMGPLTRHRPKALIPILGKPFLQYQMEWLARSGVTHLTFSIGHLGEQIEAFVKSNPIPELTVDFVYEGKELLGTGGALRHAFDQGRLHEAFVLVYGDSYLPLNVSQVFKHFQNQNQPALMTVFKNNGRFDRSNCHFEDGQVEFYSKTKTYSKPLIYIDYGLSVIKRHLIEDRFQPGEKADLATLFEHLSQEGQLAGYEVFERFYEIGSPQGLEEFTAFAKCHLT